MPPRLAGPTAKRGGSLRWCIPNTATRGQPPRAGGPDTLPPPGRGTGAEACERREALDGAERRDEEGLPASGLLGGNCSRTMPALRPSMHVLWPPPNDGEGLRICMLDTTYRPPEPASPVPWRGWFFRLDTGGTAPEAKEARSK